MKELSIEELQEFGGALRPLADGPMVRAATDRLCVTNPLFHEFFQKYAGPFWSQSLCYEMLDPVVGRKRSNR